MRRLVLTRTLTLRVNVTEMYIDRGQQEAGMSEAAQSTMGHDVCDVYQT